MASRLRLVAERPYQLPIGVDTWEIRHTASRRLLIVFST
jgi:hypothetical protein